MMKKVKVYIVLFLIGCFSFGGMYYVSATKERAKATVKKEEVNLNFTTVPTQLYQELLTAEDQAVLIDVRISGELVSGKLKDAINIDVTSGSFETELVKLDKTRPYFVYSAIGDRGERAMNIMKKLGFSEVYNLSGGIREWKLEGEEVVK